MTDGRNTGHGYVFLRPDGVQAKCGGPTVCPVCMAEQAKRDAPVEPMTMKDHAKLAGINVGANYVHIRNGTTYRVLSLAKMEAGKDLVVIYASRDKPFELPWVRPVDQFLAKFKEALL